MEVLILLKEFPIGKLLMISTVCICLTSIEKIQFLLQVITISFVKFIRNYTDYGYEACEVNV